MAEWWDWLVVPLGYDYMVRALWVSAMIGVVCGFLSAFITLKGWSLMGDALSHAVVPGVALAYLLGLPFVEALAVGVRPLAVECTDWVETVAGGKMVAVETLVEAALGHRISLVSFGLAYHYCLGLHHRPMNPDIHHQLPGSHEKV